MVDPSRGWLHGGIIQQVYGEKCDQALVAFTDYVVRGVPAADLQSIKTVPIPPQQLASTLVPNVFSLLAGTSPTGESSSPAWIAAAAAWDVLLVLAIVGVVCQRLSPREWLFPACMLATTIVALLAVAGAPANADRHRPTETVPLLVVLASGLLASRPSERSAVANQAKPPSVNPVGPDRSRRRMGFRIAPPR